MAERVTLELVCGRCGAWWVRWTVDADRPFAEQASGHAGRRVHHREVSAAWRPESPGMYHTGLGGRWTPDQRRDWTDGEEWDRVRFVCESGCASNVQVRLDRLEAAAALVVKHLHDTRTPMLRTTVDTLLKFSA